MTEHGHAVVLGAGMGGLLAARVLADAYDRVTVLERDRLPGTAGNRRGVPQGRHVHALLPRGAAIVDELFPGLLAELVADGAETIEDYSLLHFAPGGHRLCREMRLPTTYQPSRPFLEAHVRERVRALPNVEIRDGCAVAGLTTTPDRRRVTGVRVDAGSPETIAADLVVDALGRGARTPAWLTELGYPRPEEREVPVRLRYTSALVRLRPRAVPEKLVVIGATPDRPTGMGLFAYEHDTWLFTVAGYGDRRPSPDLPGMIGFVADRVPKHVEKALREAEPLSDVATFAFPASRWRRYDRLRRFPEGLLVFGDAICSFNPLYGQGMSVAALEAQALRRCVRRGGDHLARRFFRASAGPIGVAWRLAVGGDLALPEVEAPRPLAVRLSNRYVERVLTAAERDPVLAARFMRVSAFVDPPSALLRPSAVARALAG
ncbi:FAD-dependent oxidoreductase [Prauserella flavalba]|uniref:2-polyprenyl-6-methoxyphenol hydroxylase-like oxidoreductase n=1 Tax=Prauserella flavalba TaxID=1477506 RepID=A0A318LYN9_9PSEU|nr:FAD-dependent oxidoreductase [Prauserella flavalba]PXY35375.1 2-polyprenyl-6-methoxyphenol hydroxylase-like oxidoreductase [Prauserella flavalba]